MTTFSDPRSGLSVIHYNEPAVKKPPLLAVGALAWIRTNLFSSWFDTILTLISAAVIYGAITSFLQWAVVNANWFVISFNLRSILLGRYEAGAEWRVQLVVLLIAFVVGFAIAAWTRVARILLIMLLITLALLFVLPPVINATTTPAITYIAAGSDEIASGSTRLRPLENLGFTGRQGEVITLQMADSISESERALASYNGFSDTAANLLRNNAISRLRGIDRKAELQSLLAGDALTTGQRTALQTEFDRLAEVDPILQTYAVNQNPVVVRLLGGAELEPLLEQVIAPGSAPITYTLPRDGWYVLEKKVDGEGVSVLQTQGIYPLLERSFAISGEMDESGNIIASSGRINQYIRLTDGFLTENTRPQINGTNVTMTVVFETEYRGGRSFNDYLRVYLNPFLERVNLPLLLLAVAAAAGYFSCRTADRFFARRDQPAIKTRQVATWLIVLVPIVMLILISGVLNFSAADLGNVIGGGAWLALMFFAGVNARGAQGFGLLFAGFLAVIIQPYIPAFIWGTETLSGGVPGQILIWVVLAGAGTALAYYGKDTNTTSYLKEIGSIIAPILWAVLLIAVPPLLDVLVSSGSISAELSAMLLEASRVLSYAAWFVFMFFSAQLWGLFGVGVGLLLITTQWLSSSGVSLWYIFTGIIWLSVGLYVFNMGSNNTTQYAENIRRRNLGAAAFIWLALLIAVPVLFKVAVSQSVITAETAENLLPVTDTRRWGGLMLTIQLAVVGIVGSFPLGILLALGRRSKLPIISTVCVIYIEFVRGVPLITVLFMAQLLVPLVNPGLAEIANVYRAMVGIVLFSAAYLAENVRGGLQSIPPGQEEAAKALGLSGWQTTLYITLPQALRAVIPALVGQFISLYKDTSLVAIVGLLDLTGMSELTAVQTEFLGLRREIYIVLVVIYFSFSYVMSRISRMIEVSGAGAARRI